MNKSIVLEISGRQRDNWVSVHFNAAGASLPRTAGKDVTKCSSANEDTWCKDHCCEQWYCACDNAGASGGDWCGYHNRKVSECREQVCPTHNCPYENCPKNWCHEHSDLYAECDVWWCRCHNCYRSECGDVWYDPDGGGGSTPADDGETEYASGDGAVVAVNNDDDDASGSPDTGETGVEGENDLVPIWPLGIYSWQCCPCPEHHTQGAESARLVSFSNKLRLFAGAEKTGEYSTEDSVSAGAAVYVEGQEASESVGAERILWEWTDQNNHVNRVTNDFTVLSVRLFGDLNLDDYLNDADKALAPSLSSEYGWCMPVATNDVYRLLQLRTDVGLQGGTYTLSLSGDAGFRVWAMTPASGAPLLVCGQTVTNGVNGVSFRTGDEADLYVEAVSNGTATVTYAYEGTGDAAGISCSASLKMTAWEVEINVSSPKLGVSPNPPPFAGQSAHVFRPDRSPETDQHAVVLYKDAVDANFDAEDFDVALTGSLKPSVASQEPLSFSWQKVSGPESGELLASTSLSATYRNPKNGGVYRFRLTVRSGDKDLAFCEANLVLPLAGAVMDSVVNTDLFKADAFAVAMRARYNPRQLQQIGNWRRWFWDQHAGDYTGRPDSVDNPTVWFYNQVNDDSGFGAVCTWMDRPVRLTKLSNFILGYAMQQIGTSRAIARRGTGLFTISETTDRASVGAGWDVANGGNYDTTVSTLVDYIWTHETENDKSRRVWPNSSAPDNYKGSSTDELFDYNTWYGAPGFLFMTQ